MFRISKTMKIENRLLFAWVWWGEAEMDMTADRCEIFWGEGFFASFLLKLGCDHGYPTL